MHSGDVIYVSIVKGFLTDVLIKYMRRILSQCTCVLGCCNVHFNVLQFYLLVKIMVKTVSFVLCVFGHN